MNPVARNSCRSARPVKQQESVKVPFLEVPITRAKDARERLRESMTAIAVAHAAYTLSLEIKKKRPGAKTGPLTGGPSPARTGDLLIKSQLLYQLS